MGTEKMGAKGMESVVDESVIAKRLDRRKLRENRSQSLGTKLTFEEEREIEQAAEKDGKTASEWAREVLLREARQKGDPMFTELVAMRMLLNHVLPPIAERHGVTADDFAGIIAEVRREKHEVTRQLRDQYSGKLPQEQ